MITRSSHAYACCCYVVMTNEVRSEEELEKEEEEELCLMKRVTHWEWVVTPV